MGLYMENRHICSRLFGLCLLLASTVASAHELWLDSEKFQYEIGDKVEVSLINGTQFDGVNLPYFTRRVSELYYSIDTRIDATSRLGDLPAFQQVIDTAGLARFVYVSKIDNITYRGLKKFSAFVEEKDATWALQRHLDNNWPTDRFTERYFRHSKALIDIGHGHGADETFGLFVAIGHSFRAIECSMRLKSFRMPVLASGKLYTACRESSGTKFNKRHQSSIWLRRINRACQGSKLSSGVLMSFLNPQLDAGLKPNNNSLPPGRRTRSASRNT